jgi:hypothetical protein
VRRTSLTKLVAAPALSVALLGPGAAQASAACPNDALRIGLSAALPGCRAYELVTPVDKGPTADLFGVQKVQAVASTSGDRVMVPAGTQSLPGATAGFGNTYVMDRTPSGWRTRVNSPADADGLTYKPAVVDADLTREAGASALAKAFNPTTYSLFSGPLGGPFAGLAPLPATNRDAVVGMSRDGGHVLFQSLARGIAPGDAGLAGQSLGLYEWDNGAVRLVSVDDHADPTTVCGAVLGGAASNGYLRGGAQNAVSSDGAKVFFESPDPNAAGFGATDPSCQDPVRLYLRSGGKTIDVSAAQPGVVDPNGRRDVQYAGAAADGSRVYFTTPTRLTADDTNDTPDLYEYDVADDTLTRASAGTSGSAEANVYWVVVSDDGNVVYFVGSGALTEDSVAQDPGPADGPANIFRYDAVSKRTTFLGEAENKNQDYSYEVAVPFANYGAGGGTGPSHLSNWYASPDGRFLLFRTETALAGWQIYRYDAEAATRVCVSCSPKGEPSSDAPRFEDQNHQFQSAQYTPARGMSDDGRYVFFDSPDQLLPADTNATRDVYEWHDGKLSLLSGGDDGSDAVFLNASADGRDVFIGTHAKLVPADVDTSGDIYDVRIGGGYAPAPAGPAPCDGDACQGSASSMPFVAAPASMSVGPLAGPADRPVTQKPRTFSVARVTAAQVRALARSGRVTLHVRLSAAGRVTAVASAQIGARTREVARASRTFGGAVSAGVPLRLSALARRELRRRGRLTVRIKVTVTGAAAARVTTLHLRAGATTRADQKG